MSNIRDELERKFVEFAELENLLDEKLEPKEDIEFIYRLKYPPKSKSPLTILAFKKNDTNCIAINILNKVSESRIQVLKSKGLYERFFHLVKLFLLSKNVFFHIEREQKIIAIIEEIYLDALTMDNLLKTIRKVYNYSLFINLYLDLLVDTKTKKDSMLDMFGMFI